MDDLNNKLNNLNLNKDLLMDNLQKEFVNLKIKNKPKEEKKYIIKKETRDYLNNLDYSNLSIIPYFCNPKNINNFNKKYYVNITNIILLNNQIINTKIRTKKSDEKKIDYLNYIETCIDEYLINNFDIKDIKKTNFKKILEIEKSKIIVYSINISSIKTIPNNFTCKKFIDFYTNNNVFSKNEFNIKNFDKKILKKKKIKRKIYENILLTHFNKNHLQSLFDIIISKDHNIKIKLFTIYNHIYK